MDSRGGELFWLGDRSGNTLAHNSLELVGVVLFLFLNVVLTQSVYTADDQRRPLPVEPERVGSQLISRPCRRALYLGRPLQLGQGDLQKATAIPVLQRLPYSYSSPGPFV